MKKTIPLSVLATLCLFGSVSPQVLKPIKALSVGDTLPAMRITRLVNSRAPAIDTKAYQDQLLIIDFWATWCSSCIKMFPVVEALQTKFKGKVQFLAVDSWAGDTQEKVQALFSRHPEWNFPSLYGDTTLNKLFPHQGIPFYVWIKNKRLIATTGMEAINADTIGAVLNSDRKPAGQNPIEFTVNRPIFVQGNGGEPTQYTYRSLLAPAPQGMKTLIWRDTDEHGLTNRIAYTNASLYQLLAFAFPVLGQTSKNRITTGYGVELNVLNNDQVTGKSRERFTYEAIFPKRKYDDALQLMQEDMRRYFNLTIDSMTQEMDCLVFTTDPSLVKDKTPASGTPETNWYTPEQHIPITLSHYPLDEALQLFDEVSAQPILNETKANPAITIRLKGAAVNEAELRNVLKPYGVKIHREKRKIKVLVIRKTGTNHQTTNLYQP